MYPKSILFFSLQDWRANLAKDFFEINIPPMRALEFMTGHMVYNLFFYLNLTDNRHLGQKYRFL